MPDQILAPSEIGEKSKGQSTSQQGVHLSQGVWELDGLAELRSRTVCTLRVRNVK